MYHLSLGELCVPLVLWFVVTIEKTRTVEMFSASENAMIVFLQLYI